MLGEYGLAGDGALSIILGDSKDTREGGAVGGSCSWYI
jgi:hypothetical protein